MRKTSKFFSIISCTVLMLIAAVFGCVSFANVEADTATSQNLDLAASSSYVTLYSSNAPLTPSVDKENGYVHCSLNPNVTNLNEVGLYIHFS